jgi:hypothetical protein
MSVSAGCDRTEEKSSVQNGGEIGVQRPPDPSEPPSHGEPFFSIIIISPSVTETGYACHLPCPRYKWGGRRAEKEAIGRNAWLVEAPLGNPSPPGEEITNFGEERSYFCVSYSETSW